MSCIRKIACTDPLIDFVSPNNLISERCEILNIDLLTVTIAELDFVSQYKMIVKNKDNFHGYVSWFDCYFSCTDNKICLSTSPYGQQTHWKQTIL